jgi:Icc-related predicted phosphoesterase
MRIHILSDLHLESAPMEVPDARADVVILAGDIGMPAQAVEWARGFGVPVLYVPGNHEFYDGTIEAVRTQLAVLAAGSNVRMLDDAATVVRGIRFLGSTLWTDYRLYPEGEARDRATRETEAFMRDFRMIQEAPGRLLEAGDVVRRCAVHRAWLEARLAERFDGPTVVVTHHSPSPRSIAQKYAGNPINMGYASDLESLMGADRVALWVHGHMHDGFDYVVAGTRVVCNPRGYARPDGLPQNTRFDPRFVVDL